MHAVGSGSGGSNVNNNALREAAIMKKEEALTPQISTQKNKRKKVLVLR